MPILENGEIVQKQVCKCLAPLDKKYKSKRAVAPLALKFLPPVNAGTLRAESTQLVMDFVESVYFPHAKEKKRPSTYKGYKDTFKYHLNGRLGDIRMRDFRTVIGKKLLADISAETELPHESLRSVKSFLSGVFKLNAPIPIPRSVLRQGFVEAGQEWMWGNWGVRWPIRRVTFAIERQRNGGVEPVAVYRFISEDWSPWIALLRLRKRWPELRFEMKAEYLELDGK